MEIDIEELFFVAPSGEVGADAVLGEWLDGELADRVPAMVALLNDEAGPAYERVIVAMILLIWGELAAYEKVLGWCADPAP